jgi:hypothetical protein
VALRSEALFPKDGKFTYPKHPFDPAFCDMIASLPQGFTEMALSGVLSRQITLLIARINIWNKKMSRAFKTSGVWRQQDMTMVARHVTLCGEFIYTPSLSTEEILLILALLGFCYSLDTSRAMFWLTNAYTQIRCRHVLTLPVRITGKNESYMTYIGTVLVASFDPSSQASLLGQSILRKKPKPANWQENVKLCEEYFWNDALSLRLGAKIGYLEQSLLKDVE